VANLKFATRINALPIFAYDDTETKMKSCFVISPIGAPGSQTREHADDVFDFIIKPAAEKAGYAPVRADHEARPGTITEHMYDHILGDDLLIALLSGHNPNVFYEVAVAEAAARPLILLIDGTQEIPFDISMRRVLQYDLKPRALQTGTHIDALVRSIKELEATGGGGKVPFRPDLKPLGASEAGLRLVPRSRDVPREELLRIISAAQSFVRYEGLALFSFAKIKDFEEAVRATLSRGVAMRVLLIHPDNPALAGMTREFTTNYLDSIRGEIRAGAEFWTKLKPSGQLSLRFQKTGAMFGLLQQSDAGTIFTQYSSARPTSECATILAPANSPFHIAMTEDSDWHWQHAIPEL
jgi:hypothetical protein